MTQVRYKIAISDIALDRKPATPSEWNAYQRSFTNRLVTLDELLTFILAGHGHAPWHHNGEMKLGRFQCGQHIAIDIDTEDGRARIDNLLNNWFVCNYAAVIHATFSSTPQKPRSRVIFLLDEPITSATGYRAAVRTVQALIPGADRATVNPNRTFLGTRPDAEISIPGFGLPVEYLRQLYQVQQQAERQIQRRVQHDRPLDSALLTKWIDRLVSAPVGERNNTLNRAAFVAGRLASEGQVDAESTAELLFEAARACGLDEAETWATIRSGFKASGVFLPRK